jgi:hypothetical protein
MANDARWNALKAEARSYIQASRYARGGAQGVRDAAILSVLSDVQELIARGATEQANDFVNVAKLIADHPEMKAQAAQVAAEFEAKLAGLAASRPRPYVTRDMLPPIGEIERANG